MDQLNHVGEEGMVFSVDYEKCFDRIEINSMLEAMKVFGFNEEFVAWVKVLNSGNSVQVVNSGYLSEPIKVTRGCRQGSLGSPYYFLICAELLAIKLRNNENIEGFSINSFNKLFGQYADDLDLYCKTTQNDLDQIMETLTAFCKITGCKVNYDKTTLYRIGPDNKALANIYTRGMRVEENTINILGITIHRDKEEMMKSNYEPLLIKIKGILNTWTNRNLDLFAKITVINTLIASLFVYKMLVLPDLKRNFIVKFNKMIEDFIWNGRKTKIPLSKLQNEKSWGGGGWAG